MLDEVKSGILLAKLVPLHMKQHLALNSARLDTHHKLRHEIVEFEEMMKGQLATETASDPIPMEISPLYQPRDNSRRSLSAKGKHKTKGKGKGKSKSASGKPSSKNKDKGGSSSSYANNAPPAKFEGYCYSCGKKGHKASDCWDAEHLVGAIETLSPVPEEDDEFVFGLNSGSIEHTLLDSGAAEHLCPENFQKHLGTEKSKGGPNLRTATGLPVQRLGSRVVTAETEKGDRLTVRYEVANVKRPVVSVWQLVKTKQFRRQQIKSC